MPNIKNEKKTLRLRPVRQSVFGDIVHFVLSASVFLILISMKTKEEIWEPVKGYRGFYAVSNKGRIKRIAGGLSKNEKIMKPDSNGTREHIYLSNGYNKKRFLILDLVKEAFPDTKMKRKIKPVTVIKEVARTYYPVTIIERTDELLERGYAKELALQNHPIEKTRKKVVFKEHNKATKGKWFNP